MKVEKSTADGRKAGIHLAVVDITFFAMWVRAVGQIPR